MLLSRRNDIKTRDSGGSNDSRGADELEDEIPF
jgi:hypothetical protein